VRCCAGVTEIPNLLRTRAQFFDSKFVCQGEGREVSRVKKSGKLLLSLNVVTKGGIYAAYYRLIDRDL
jgi:hypothetical protein